MEKVWVSFVGNPWVIIVMNRLAGANALLERFLGADGNLSLDSVVTLPVTKAL